MIRTLSEKEFIAENGELHYMALARDCYQQMREAPEYRNNQPMMHTIAMYDWQFNDGRTGHILLEANIKKIGSIPNQVDDFGIVSIKITDEDIPDEFLDRYNDIMKLKK